MWWAGSEPETALYVSAMTAALHTPGQELALHAMANATDASSSHEGAWCMELVALLRQLPKARGLRLRRRPLRVWLGGGLCRAFNLPLPQGLADQAELQRLAEALAPQASSQTVPLTVWIDPSSRGTSTVAVAVPTELLKSLMQATADASMRVVGVAPWWSGAQRALCTHAGPMAQCELALAEPDALTVLRTNQDQTLHAITWAPVRSRADMAALLRRPALGDDVDVKRLVVELRLAMSPGSTEAERDPATGPSGSSLVACPADMPFAPWVRCTA